MSEPIREVFGGDVAAFLSSGDAFFNGVGTLLEQQVDRASPLEQAVLYWLAVAREPTTLDHLVAARAGDGHRGAVLRALEALRHRALIERVGRGASFTLQPVIMEYMTARLVADVCRDIERGAPVRIVRHALVQATSKDYVRRSQERLIAAPVLNQLVASYGGAEEAARRLVAVLGSWRRRPPLEQGYG
ncbi:MAG: hypothetical protein M3380_11245, partial [Chloroflexota bacterium]|nr:hypothetical protein [Chloroflexota bacterium]